MTGVVTSNGKSSTLSDAEVSYLQSFLNVGDRAGFYMAYYSMAGADDFVPSSVGKAEAGLQAKISTFSGQIGAIAYLSTCCFEDAKRCCSTTLPSERSGHPMR